VGGARGRRDLVCDSRLRDHGAPRRGVPERLRGDAGARWSRLGGIARRARVRQVERVRRRAQSPRLATAGLRQTLRAPLLTTIHGFSGRNILPAYQSARSSHFVSISNADRAKELSYLATVYHGIDLNALPHSPRGGDALVVFGRIHPRQGHGESPSRSLDERVGA